MTNPNAEPGFQAGNQSPDLAGDGAEAEHLAAGDTTRVLGELAITEGESPQQTSAARAPKYFRDHTNPVTMKMPDWWGSTRRT